MGHAAGRLWARQAAVALEVSAPASMPCLTPADHPRLSMADLSDVELIDQALQQTFRQVRAC